MDRRALEVAQLASAMLATPAGRALLLTALDSGLAASEIVKLEIACELAACAVETVGRWRGDRADIFDMLFRGRPELEALANAALASPDAAQWFSPLDPTAQIWFSDDGTPPMPAAFEAPATPSAWELYAQKCAGGLYTTTLVGQTSALHAVLAYGTGDMPARFQGALLTLFKLHIQPGVRVFEVDGPQAWHALCVRYPAKAADGRLTPDWSRVAMDWHAVHITLGGVLLAEQVRTSSLEGWSEFDSWDFEQTLWLHCVFERAERLWDLSWPLSRTTTIRML